MIYTKEEIETRLKESIKELLECVNWEDSILELKYNEKTQTCEVKFNVVIIEEDDYIGLSGY